MESGVGLCVVVTVQDGKGARLCVKGIVVERGRETGMTGTADGRPYCQRSKLYLGSTDQ